MISRKLISWLDERLHLNSVITFLSEKKVPQHRHSVWYLFGGLAFFLFMVQLVTGMLLTLYYSPTPSTAHESVEMIVTKVSFGWLMRSVHSWSSHLMVGVVFIHLCSVYFMKAYRKPREIMWFSGVLLLFLILGFGFTGYLLPWDVTAYFATQIGTEIPRSMPLVGELVVYMLRGGEFIAEESLKRLFALHVMVLPIVTLSLIIFHLVLNQVHGSSIPLDTQVQGRGRSFYPNYMYRDTIAWVCVFTVLCGLAILFPVQLGAKADQYAAAPVGIKPEWYFLPLYQTLRMVPATILGMPSESVVNVAVVLSTLILFAVPFLDRKSRHGTSSKLFLFGGVVSICYIVLSITLAYVP